MWDRGHIFTNLNCIQRVMTLVSEKFLTIEKLKVLIFFVVVVYSVYSCEECNYMFSNYASCTGESVCVYGAEYVRVECWLRNIRSDTFIKQLLVRGNCGAASRFKQLCSQGVGFIEMMNSNDTFPCAGNPPPLSTYFLDSRKKLHNPLRWRVHVRATAAVHGYDSWESWTKVRSNLVRVSSFNFVLV